LIDTNALPPSYTANTDGDWPQKFSSAYPKVPEKPLELAEAVYFTGPDALTATQPTINNVIVSNAPANENGSAT